MLGKERKRLMLPAEVDSAVEVEEGAGSEGVSVDGSRVGTIEEHDAVQKELGRRNIQPAIAKDEGWESSRYREG